MRIKQLWPLPSSLRLAYSLVILNLPTAIFFLLSLLQFITLSGVHGWLVSHHRSFTLQIEEIALDTRVISRPLVVLSGDQFFLCDAIPRFAGGPGNCTKVSYAQNQPFNATGTLNANSSLVQTLANHTQPDALRSAARQCAKVSPWVFQELRAANHEDIFFIVFQFWLLCISLSAVLSQSIPHLMTALASKIFASVATSYRIAGTPHFEAEFGRLVTNGACHGIDLLRGYFPPRHTTEIIICVVNCTMLVVLAGLTYHLAQVYGRDSFERVQRRLDMSRLYIVLLSLSSSVHLATFFIVASLGLFTDQLVLGPLRDLALDKAKSVAIHAVTYALFLPWIFLGWTCRRAESKRRIAAFIAFTLAFLVLWAGSFTCSTNRFVFLTWDVFAALTIASGFFLVCILVLGIYIWLHLDLGLAAYLKRAEPPYPADEIPRSFVSMSDTEKGYSPPLVDGSAKLFPPVVEMRSPSPSNSSISTESNTPSDSINPIKSHSAPLDSHSAPEITTPRRVRLGIFQMAQRARTTFYQGILTRNMMVSPSAPPRQPSTHQSSASVGTTPPMDITDSWVRRHIATSVIISAPPTPIDSHRL